MLDQEFFFSKLTVEERLQYLADHSPLSSDELAAIHARFRSESRKKWSKTVSAPTVFLTVSLRDS